MLLYPKPSNTSYLDMYQSPTESRMGEKKDCVMGSGLITLELWRRRRMLCSSQVISLQNRKSAENVLEAAAVWAPLASVRRKRGLSERASESPQTSSRAVALEPETYRAKTQEDVTQWPGEL